MYLSNSNHSKAAGYLRLSREDGDKVESDSITSQRDLIRGYVNDRSGMTLVDEYVDDGYSGTSFDRPAFKRLMQDIEQKKVDCIIVKDLSRLGRNYIETGKYLERIFPAMGVRFVAINDHYDSFDDKNDSDQIIIPFKNLINDAYCRDISIKIRSQLDIKRKNGQFIGSFAGYGYTKDPKDKNHLIIDEDAAEVVRMIYNLKLDGYSPNRIADKLNEMKIVTPMEYKLKSGLNYRSGFRSGKDSKWTPVTVKRILKNELYIGVTIQGKRQKINYKVRQSRDIDESEWIRVEGTHEPIIPRNVFDIVQEMLSRDTRTSPDQQKVYLFSGYLRCPDCGKSMVRRTVKKKGKHYYYYHCSTYNSGNGCSSHLISEKRLTDAVLAAVRQQIAVLVSAAELIDGIASSEMLRPGLKAITRQIDSMRSEITRYSKLISQLYQDYQSGVVGQEEYKDINARFSDKLTAAKQTLERMEEQRKELMSEDIKSDEWIDSFREFHNIQKLDRKTVVSLIDHIDIFDRDHIEIHFRHEDELAEINEWMASYEDDADREGVSAE